MPGTGRWPTPSMYHYSDNPGAPPECRWAGLGSGAMPDVATAPPFPRWTVEQVLTLAPDASAQKGARSLATPRPWRATGFSDGDPPTLWGLCQGSGANPYQACVDLAEPAYRCSCPSRKFPCKHAIGLLLLWSGGGVAPAEPPAWVAQWQAARAERQQTAAVRATRSTNPASTAQSQQRRRQRVD